MISEGSCDTEDWSNDAENTALITEINYTLKYIQTEIVILNCNNISQFYCIFYFKIAVLVSRRDFSQKHVKTYRPTDPKLLKSNFLISE